MMCQAMPILWWLSIRADLDWKINPQIKQTGKYEINIITGWSGKHASVWGAATAADKKIVNQIKSN